MILWLADAQSHAIQDALQLIATGMAVVFSSLLLLLAMVSLLNRLRPGAKPPAPPPEAAALETAPGGPGSIDGELIAVLTAAATVALQRRIRVTRIRFVKESDRIGPSGWIVQGRVGILGSHRPQARKPK
ncbi:MAG: OadG family protein [Phycisphaeraceae bacterium]|nr:OadG family protein [Phycisphaeraceae bacterium]